MNETYVRALVREQVRKKIILESFEKVCDAIIEERRLNELAMSDFTADFDMSDIASKFDLDDLTKFTDSATSWLGDKMGPAFTNAIKQYVVELLFKKLASMGLPTDRTSIVGSALVNTLAEIEWSDLSKYFEDEKACGEITDVLMAGIQTGLQEQGMHAIFEVLFGTGARVEGIVSSPIRELINLKLLEMSEGLRVPIKEFFCDHRDFDKLIGDFKAGLPDMEMGGKIFPEPAAGAAASKKYTSDEIYDMIGRGS